MAQSIRYPKLGASLESARGNKSMRRIAQETRVDYGHINRVFHGQSLPSRKILLSICRSMNCSHEKAVEIFTEAEYLPPTIDELEIEEESAA